MLPAGATRGLCLLGVRVCGLAVLFGWVLACGVGLLLVWGGSAFWWVWSGWVLVVCGAVRVCVCVLRSVLWCAGVCVL